MLGTMIRIIAPCLEYNHIGAALAVLIMRCVILQLLLHENYSYLSCCNCLIVSYLSRCLGHIQNCTRDGVCAQVEPKTLHKFAAATVD